MSCFRNTVLSYDTLNRRIREMPTLWGDVYWDQIFKEGEKINEQIQGVNIAGFVTNRKARRIEAICIYLQIMVQSSADNQSRVETYIPLHTEKFLLSFVKS